MRVERPLPHFAGALRNGSIALLTIALATGAALIPLTGPELTVPSAQAQRVSLIAQFRVALAPHGRWVRHPRWGEVWVPADRDRDWRPYSVGHWVYTDEWGWFWVSDEDFGWVTYHYGRWVLDRRIGWIWIPGETWGPAWVQWRRGDRYAGWAPLPPDEVVFEYDEDPEFWILVSLANFTTRNVHRVIVPPRERVVYIRETVIVNRTIVVDRGPRIAVNPGIAPQIVAARTGRPIRVAAVRPVVVEGTAGVQGAVALRAEQVENRRDAVRAQVVERQETVAPATEVPAPKPLSETERKSGRLGERPPRAAQEATKGEPPAKAEPKIDAPAKVDPKADAPAKAEPKTKDEQPTKGDPKGDRKVEPKDAPKAMDEPRQPPKSEPKADTRKVEPKESPKAKNEPKESPKAKDEPRASPKAEPKVERKTEPKEMPKAKDEPRATPKVEPKVERKVEPKEMPKARDEPRPQPKASVPAPQVQPKGDGPDPQLQKGNRPDKGDGERRGKDKGNGEGERKGK